MSTLRQQHIEQFNLNKPIHESIPQNLDSIMQCNLNNLGNHIKDFVHRLGLGILFGSKDKIDYINDQP